MNFIKRAIVAVLFIPLLLWLYLTGGVWLQVFLCLLTVLSTYELIKMGGHSGKWKVESGKLSSSCISIAEYINIFFSMLLFLSISFGSLYLFHIILITVIYNGAWYVFTNRLDGSVSRISYSLFTVIYPAVGFGLMYSLSDMANYPNTLLPILAILIWITDTFAYFTGILIGKYKNVFTCSPNKSAEGFIGGLVFTFVASYAVTLIFPEYYTFRHVIYFTIAAGIFGQFGDLLESPIKRDMGVKDSSGIIPGHGGVLDRFDSVLIASPVLWCLL